jgi:uncharacterized protein YndB with AHSA1/START domain
MNASAAPAPLVITRTFDAPIDLVYRLWTDPALVKRWWGVRGSSIPLCELDVRVGGKWRIDMRAPSGKIYPNAGEYLEVVPNERLVYTDVPDPTIAEWQGEPPQPRRNIVRFAERGGRTVVTLQIEFATATDRERMLGFGMHHGLDQSLDRLEELIASLEGHRLHS